jgi:hypothetical protein
LIRELNFRGASLERCSRSILSCLSFTRKTGRFDEIVEEFKNSGMSTHDTGRYTVGD